MPFIWTHYREGRCFSLFLFLYSSSMSFLEDKMLVLFEWIYRTKWLNNAKMRRIIGVIVNNR